MAEQPSTQSGRDLAPIDYVRCPHCSYWHAPESPHTIEDCTSNLRAVNQDLQRQRDEYKVRADMAEDTITEMKRVLRDA